MTKDEIIKEANELLKEDLMQIINNVDLENIFYRVKLAIENREIFIQENLDFWESKK